MENSEEAISFSLTFKKFTIKIKKWKTCKSVSKHRPPTVCWFRFGLSSGKEQQIWNKWNIFNKNKNNKRVFIFFDYFTLSTVLLSTSTCNFFVMILPEIVVLSSYQKEKLKIFEISLKQKWSRSIHSSQEVWLQQDIWSKSYPKFLLNYQFPKIYILDLVENTCKDSRGKIWPHLPIQWIQFARRLQLN